MNEALGIKKLIMDSSFFQGSIRKVMSPLFSGKELVLFFHLSLWLLFSCLFYKNKEFRSPDTHRSMKPQLMAKRRL